MQSLTVRYKYCTAAAAFLSLCRLAVLHMPEFTDTHTVKTNIVQRAKDSLIMCFP